jgi:LysM repeat protein
MFKRFQTLGASIVLAVGLAMPMFSGPADAQGPCGPRVVVGFGDTLFRIAARCGTTAAAILQMNPQITNPNVIHLGQVIHLSPGSVAGPMPPRHPPGGSSSVYIVRPGDTLYRISFITRVPLRELLAANPHVDPRFLRPGMRIRLPRHWVAQPHPQPMPPRPPAGIIAITGVVTDEGATCPAVRARDGRLYTLAGATGRLRPGDRVEVEGRIARTSICMQGTTIEVQRIRTVRSDHDDDDDGSLSITGVVTDEGVECTAIRGSDGRLYTIADGGGLRPGDRVHVRGRRAQASFCMQGITIDVERLRRLG